MSYEFGRWVQQLRVSENQNDHLYLSTVSDCGS